jgi:serine/threonine-protein kinase
MDPDRNLLFGVLALQADLLDPARFIEACTAWAACKERPLADLVVERGWITSEDRADVERLLGRKLRKHGGDAHASLVEIATLDVQRTIAGLSDPELRQTLAETGSPASAGQATITHIPERQERYRLNRVHARGGIGQVWLAHDSRLGRDVALKELLPDRAGQPSIRERFLREAHITGQLEHPGIVPIYDLDHRPDHETLFYTMRFVHGRTLGEAAASYHARRARHEAGPLELRELLAAFIGVCNAVAYAHSRGVLHRDLKPHNVVLGDFGEVILLDWGLARLLDPSRAESDSAPAFELPGDSSAEATVQGQVLGTPAYMAPEQADARPDLFSERTDVYGLGAVLFEILTGEPPFGGPNALAILAQVVVDAPVPPRQRVATLPRALEAICLQALAKRPQDRYPSAKALAADVQRWLGDEPVQAYREPLFARITRWTRRHRTTVLAGAAAVTVATVCLAVASILLLRASREVERQRDEARTQRDKARVNFRLAREAVDYFDTKVSQSPEMKARGLELLRSALLGSAADFYQRFVDEEAEDADVQFEQGLALQRLGKLYRTLGRQARAEMAFRQALNVFDRLSEADSERLDYQVRLAETYRLLGKVHSALSRRDQAEQAFHEAVAICDRLRKVAGSKDDVEQVAAGMQQELGIFYAAAGKNEAAEKAYQAARTGWQQLVSAHPNNQDEVQNLATTLMDLGILYVTTNRRESAENPFREARALNERLVAANSDEPDYQDSLAESITSLAVLYDETGRHERAIEAFGQARSRVQQLAEAHPHVLEYQLSLARANNNLGVSYRKQLRDDLAEPSYRASVATFQHLVEVYPQVTKITVSLGVGQLNLGNLTRDLGKFDEALGWYAQSRQTLEGVLKKEPRQALANLAVALTHGGEALTLARLGRHAEARTHGETAARLCPAPPVAELPCERALVFALAGEHAQAAATAAEAAKDPAVTGRELQSLAGACALAAGAVSRDTKRGAEERNDLRERYSKMALEYLRKAQAQGFFHSKRAIELLGKDPDVAALQGRADYQGFVAELGKQTPDK